MHRHLHLVGGLATQAAKYPPKLVRAVLKALREQLVADGELNAVDLGFGGPVPSLPNFDPADPELETTLQNFTTRSLVSSFRRSWLKQPAAKNSSGHMASSSTTRCHVQWQSNEASLWPAPDG